MKIKSTGFKFPYKKLLILIKFNQS